MFILLSSHWLIFRIIITTICFLFFLPFVTIFVSSSTFLFKVYTLFSPNNIVLKYLSSTPHSLLLCVSPTLQRLISSFLSRFHILCERLKISYGNSSLPLPHFLGCMEILERNLLKICENTLETCLLHLINTMRFHFKKL